MTDLPFIVATLGKRGLFKPGPPRQLLRQLGAVHRWGYGLAGALRAAAARSPDRVALIDDDGSFTYRELLGRCELLAAALQDEVGVRPGDRVGILDRNGSALVSMVTAVMMNGADVVLVNPGLAYPQLQAMAQQQQLRLFCHGSEFTDFPSDIELLAMGSLDELYRRARSRVLRPQRRPGRVITLTSGTTNSSRGVARTSPKTLGPLASVLSRIPLRTGECIAIEAPLFHAWGLGALQIAWGLRATIVLHRRFTAGAALADIMRHRCTALVAVPVMLHRLLELPVRPTLLRIVAVSGSSLSGTLATHFMDAYGDVLYNLYGSTEATWITIATPDELRRAPGTVGRPPRGIRVSILGEHDQPTKPDTVGRIVASNEMLKTGWVDTGDLGHVDSWALLHVDGRRDDMVISGGENVFPQPVEEVIGALPNVREVAVTGVADPEYGQRLAAHIVLHDGQTVTPDEIRAHVRRHLGAPSVPRDVLFRDHLRRNETGKVVRSALEPDQEHP